MGELKRMGEIISLSDSDFDNVVQENTPALLLFSNGENLRNEFSIAFKKAAEEEDHETLVFGRINPDDNQGIVERFDIGSKAVLIAYYKGEELARRSRPWGVDVPLAIEMLENAYREDHPIIIEEAEEPAPNESKDIVVDNVPVNVTDDTFQAEVIDYHLPVVVDFWAEWCGPCKMVAPILDKLAEEFAGKIRIAKVDVDENQGLAQTFRVMSIPTIMMVKDRTIVFSQPGALPEPALRDLFTQLIDLEVPEQEEQPAQ